MVSDIASVRKAIDAPAPCPAAGRLHLGLASADLRHDEWGIDVTIGGSQKGLMLPPASASRDLAARLRGDEEATLPRAFWAWEEIVAMNVDGYWPSTPNTNLLYGLDASLDMLLGEGLTTVFARHQRWAAGVRAGVAAGACRRSARPRAPLAGAHRVMMPAGVDADAVRRISTRFDLSLAPAGPGQGRMFPHRTPRRRNDLTLLGTLAGCEMGLKIAGVRLAGSGVQAAMEHFSSHGGRAGWRTLGDRHRPANLSETRR